MLRSRWHSPLIDLSPLNSPESGADALARLVAEIGDACKKWGFFQVINHGVPSHVRERIELASKSSLLCRRGEEEDELYALNYYPPCACLLKLALGLGRQRTSGAMTILAQDDVEGLKVKRKSDGEWIFRQNLLLMLTLLTVGDLIQVWSNDKYESVEHRVTAILRRRFSIPFFIKSFPFRVVEPLAELVDDTNSCKVQGI
ncbi:Feruloyl CoA ortho-hydroxylase F6H1-1 [Sesamum alatum]|uniref:Feruloyl CoA ortho-hydroxylase F6H1-1 n=1 Tax=Sesamum alatum TaxID=300844 RepID=A0AAE1YX17_9LAMI|nr:Feruloyl CoA ortho-hydroxylase F6H1-1 [Sesamum alatum]